MGRKSKLAQARTNQHRAAMAKEAAEAHAKGSSLDNSQGTFLMFARQLVSNKGRVRAATLSALAAYLGAQRETPLDNEELLKIWKGLFYCMWLADKPALQNRLAVSMGELIHVFDTLEGALGYVRAFYQTIVREWSLLDHLRVDKFYALLKAMQRSTLTALGRHHFPLEACALYGKVLSETALVPTALVCGGVSRNIMHHFQAALEAVVAEEMTPPEPASLRALVEPYARYYALAVNKQNATDTLESLIGPIAEDGLAFGGMTAVADMFDAVASSRDIEMHGKRRQQLYELVEMSRASAARESADSNNNDDDGDDLAAADAAADDDDDDDSDSDLSNSDTEEAPAVTSDEDSELDGEFDGSDESPESDEFEETESSSSSDGGVFVDMTPKKGDKPSRGSDDDQTPPPKRKQLGGKPLLARVDSEVTIDMTPSRKKRRSAVDRTPPASESKLNRRVSWGRAHECDFLKHEAPQSVSKQRVRTLAVKKDRSKFGMGFFR